MGKYDRPDSQIEGQISFEEYIDGSSGLIAVSRIFASARKEMNLAEQKAFVYALSQVRFTEEAKTNIVYLDKKTLARIVGVNSDSDHLSVDLNRSIGELGRHSYIKIADKDLDLYDSGNVITRVTMFKNRVRVKFEEEYLSLFTGLSKNYITLWASDIYQMTNERSVQFYEYLRNINDDRVQTNDVLLGIKPLKEMFNIPKDGKGSYMRDKGGFDRANFEKKVIDPICEDLAKCKMINLLVQSDGKYYEKVKKGNRVEGYRFYWTFTSRPSIASATEVHQIQTRVDKDPTVLKVAKDILKGEKKKRKAPEQNPFNQFEQNQYDFDELEKELLRNPSED